MRIVGTTNVGRIRSNEVASRRPAVVASQRGRAEARASSTIAVCRKMQAMRAFDSSFVD
ncbi:hypothetical protein C7S17_0327 [Burkholderia thailandensis]|nr:hypothetical protein [Burkholderia thailandensis]